MATRKPRHPVGSGAWVETERDSAMEIVRSEVDEFSFSARNELEWLNEHMSSIFGGQEINVAEVFKTPGKLRGRTPMTARKIRGLDGGDVFNNMTGGLGPDPFQSPRRLVTRSSPTKNSIDAHSQDHQSQRSQHTSLTVDSGYQSHAVDEWAPAATDSRRANGGYSDVPGLSSGSQSGEDDELSSPDKDQQNQDQDQDQQEGQEDGDEDEDEDEEDQHQNPNLLQVPHLSPHKHYDECAIDETAETSPIKMPVVSPVRLSATSPRPSSPLVIRSPRHSARDVEMMQEQETEEEDDDSDSEPNFEVHAHDDDDDDDNMPSKFATPRRNDDRDDDSGSDSPSPVRHVVRKSSLNLASLPAREPMTTKKSMGGRTSQFDLTSHYGRHTAGGRSLGNILPDADKDGMDVDDAVTPAGSPEKSLQARPDDAVDNHNKRYTQRLQDQINLLGQSSAKSRTSKSIPSLVAAPRDAKSSSPLRKNGLPSTPGAFPSDGEDDWAPSAHAAKISLEQSPHPALVRSITVDMMDDIVQATTGGNIRRSATATPILPVHHQSASEPTLARPQTPPQKKSSIPAPAKSPFRGLEELRPSTPRTPGTPAMGASSPVRPVRDSPLKQVKTKISSMFKGPKGLLASSAALMSESKASLMSPSKLDLGKGASTESLAQTTSGSSAGLGPPLYPDLSEVANPPARKTRVSAEREKEEKKREKEAKRYADQMDKLEKAREKEREKVKAYNLELEKKATEKAAKETKEVPASPKKEARVLTKKPAEVSTPAPSAIPAAMDVDDGDDDEDEDDEDDNDDDIPMEDAPRSVNRPREIKRPMKPSKESLSKIKLAPTVIRVNMNSQHTQYHPSNGALAASLHETLAPPATVQATPQVSRTAKPPPSTLRSKTSTQNLKSSVQGRPKALELAAKRKLEEEEAAQRKREQKMEIERKRAAMQEEQRRQEQEQRRQEQEQRRQEQEQRLAGQRQEQEQRLAEQRQKQRERQERQERLEAERQRIQREQEDADARKLAQRQAMLEKAKQTRAPPPVARTYPNGPPDYSLGGQGSARELPRPPSRMGALNRPDERPVNAVLTKAAHKRTMTHDGEGVGQSRNGPQFQGKDAKRRRTSNEFGADGEQLPKIKGAPVRPSGVRREPSKSGFANAPSRDFFKTSLAGQAKPGIDIGQMAKGPIPFAPSAAHKTPARIATINAAKAAAGVKPITTKASPKFANGDSIELPEIQTDDDDSDDDAGAKQHVAEWADSPDLKRALMQQESVDPHQIFGPPAPLIMEEVFSKSKDRWHKFRARTSSANWSGVDKLTEDEIRKDLQARDKIRRDGGWSYDMTRDFL